MSFIPEHFAVWTEIPVTDLKKSTDYYSAVTGTQLTISTEGPNPMAVFPTKDGKGVSGHLFEGTPAAQGQGPVVHLASNGTLEEVIKRVTAAGGKVVSDPIPIPVGRFVYTLDPDGNRIGFFERAA